MKSERQMVLDANRVKDENQSCRKQRQGKMWRHIRFSTHNDQHHLLVMKERKWL